MIFVACKVEKTPQNLVKYNGIYINCCRMAWCGVCVSVHLYVTCIVSKWLNITAEFFQFLVASPFEVLHAKHCSKIEMWVLLNWSVECRSGTKN